MINAYYFRAHMYTLVPHQVRQDMAWMADAGTDAVTIAVLEQDLYAARENIDIIYREAARANLELFAVPSRWGGMVAGAPKVPSMFAATHPETWVINQDGSPYLTPFSGPLSSVHHPATREFFYQGVETLLTEMPFSGIIWDEVKSLAVRDWSAMAREQLDPSGSIEVHTQAVADFFNSVNQHIRSIRPNIRLSMFIEAVTPQPFVEICAQIPTLDDFGCDGRPWRLADSCVEEQPDKVLLGQAERFIRAAQVNNKHGLILIENHNMPSRCLELMDTHLPDVLKLGAEHIIYYYYPRNVDDPDRQMALLSRHLRANRTYENGREEDDSS